MTMEYAVILQGAADQARGEGPPSADRAAVRGNPRHPFGTPCASRAA